MQTFGSGIDCELSKRVGASLNESAQSFVQSRLNLSLSDVQVHASFEGGEGHGGDAGQDHEGQRVEETSGVGEKGGIVGEWIGKGVRRKISGKPMSI